jgi:hypothetical protein
VSCDHLESEVIIVLKEFVDVFPVAFWYTRALDRVCSNERAKDLSRLLTVAKVEMERIEDVSTLFSGGELNVAMRAERFGSEATTDSTN